MMKSLGDITARALYATGAASLFLKQAVEGRALILAYHHVIPRRLIRENRLMTGMYLSAESFEGHLDWLTRHLRIVPLTKIVELIRSGLRWKEPLCAVTFDDGWKDVHDHALPLLEKYSAPATVFSVGSMVDLQGPEDLDSVFEAMQMTDNLSNAAVSGVAEIDALIRSDTIQNRVEKARQVIDRFRELSYDRYKEACTNMNRYLYDTFDLDSIRWKYRTMSWDNMREMQRHGIDFGYHSKTHPMLTKVSDSLLRNEIAFPFKEYRVEGISLKPIFCYPDGKFNAETISGLKDEGYAGAVTLQKGYNDSETDPFLLKRVNIHDGNGGEKARFISSIGIQNR